MQYLSSKQNHHISRLRSLRDAKGRSEAGCFLVEGWNLLNEAISYARIDTIVVDEAKKQELLNMPAMCLRHATVLSAPSFLIDYVCETKTPQGVVASVRIPKGINLDDLHGNVLALDGVQDPGNVGSMIRTAEAAGFAAVLLSPESADPFAPKTVRATMGSIFRVPLLRGDLLETLPLLQSKGYAVVSTELGGAPIQAALQFKKERYALVIGSEGKGVREKVSMLSDFRVALPMRGKVESLNASVAAGIIMYALSFLKPDSTACPHAK